MPTFFRVYLIPLHVVKVFFFFFSHRENDSAIIRFFSRPWSSEPFDVFKLISAFFIIMLLYIEEYAKWLILDNF